MTRRNGNPAVVTTGVEEGLECRCGNRGCWEVYASNSAAVRYYVQSASPVRNSKAGVRSPGQEPAFDDVLRLAEQNDPKAVEAINQMARYLGAGIARLVTGLAPDVIVVVGTPKSSPLIAGLKWPLVELGAEGFRIRSAKLGGRAVTVIAANGEIGALYGAFHFLRLLQTQQPITNLNIVQKPRLQLRMLNHWDNLDGSIERGYAGRSLWNWQELPDKVDPRLRDYARANASLGINGSALNNVNANSRSLSAEYLRKAAAIAGVFRPYGVRVFLSARFSAPIELGGLKTADPFDPEVAAWWKKKADEIYQLNGSGARRNPLA